MFEYWFMLPVAVVFSSIAMTFGVSGAALFTPVFLLVLGLPVPVAIGSALFIELFGIGSGVFGFAKRRLISYPTAHAILLFALPATIIGGLTAVWAPQRIVVLALAGFLLVIGFRILHEKHYVTPKHHSHHEDCTHTHVRLSRKEHALSALGGFFSGLSSVGAGEMSDYLLLKRFPGAAAAGTAVFVIAITALVGTITHGYTFMAHHTDLLPQVLSIIMFAVPGALIGSFIGVRFAKMLSDDMRHKLLSSLLFAIATMMIVLV